MNARISVLRERLRTINPQQAPEDFCSAAVEISLALVETGSPLEALQFLEQALKTGERLENPAGRASLHGMLGVVLARAGRHRESTEHFIVALQIIEHGTPSVDEQVQCLMGIARNLVAVGDFRGAITQYTEVQELARRRVMLEEELDAVASKIVLHEQHGEYKETVPLYRRALVLFPLLKDDAGRVAMLRGLSIALGKVGEKAEAAKYLAQWEQARQRPSSPKK